MMNKIHKLIILGLVILINACTEKKPEYELYTDLVPVPQTMEQHGEPYLLDAGTTIFYQEDTLLSSATFLKDYISRLSYEDISVAKSEKIRDGIFMSVDSLLEMPDEGYMLEIEGKRVKLIGKTPAGVFRGVQTIIQLLPREQQHEVWLAGVTIEDWPIYKWRGMHLDVCRHFYDTAFVKKYIDLLALHKMNRFHWHLTEDQGWRIEIKQYPKLTEVGAWREETMVGKNWDEFDGEPHGGFYTQQEIKEIVKYAQERFITIVPEIEMPGHSSAALAAYPHLGCT
ncbi:MAG TPA: beta-N-acetylhexosaminidase, partial [Bacteroidales bacterium]|nr:beta-N-acetylhexosaminidase [Bacteroidales bacterium]